MSAEWRLRRRARLPYQSFSGQEMGMEGGSIVTSTGRLTIPVKTCEAHGVVEALDAYRRAGAATTLTLHRRAARGDSFTLLDAAALGG